MAALLYYFMIEPVFVASKCRAELLSPHLTVGYIFFSEPEKFKVFGKLAILTIALMAMSGNRFIPIEYDQRI